MRRRQLLITKKPVPLKTVEDEPVHIVKDFWDKKAYVNGEPTDEIEGHTYRLVNTGSFDVFDVSVIETDSVISHDELIERQDNGEHVFVELENAIIRPYIDRQGNLAESIRAEGIRIVETDLLWK